MTPDTVRAHIGAAVEPLFLAIMALIAEVGKTVYGLVRVVSGVGKVANPASLIEGIMDSGVRFRLLVTV